MTTTQEEVALWPCSLYYYLMLRFGLEKEIEKLLNVTNGEKYVEAYIWEEIISQSEKKDLEKKELSIADIQAIIMEFYSVKSLPELKEKLEPSDMNTRVLIFNFRTDTVLSDVDLAIKEYYEKFDDNKIRRIKVDCEKNVFTITINILACLDDNNEEGLLSGDSVVLTELGKERIRSVVSDDYCLDNVFTILELKPRNSFIIKDHFGLKFEVIGVDIQKK